MKRFLLALLLLALPLAAQEDQKSIQPLVPTSPRTVQKLFVLKYADPQSVRALLQVFHANLDSNRDLHVIAVDATPETMAAIEDAIKRLDVPAAAPVNVDLTIQLVVGHEAEGPTGSPVPKDLDSVVTQLKNAFAFKSYSLLDTLALRTRTGEQASTTSSGATVQNGNATAAVETHFRINSISVGGDGATVHISRLQAGINMPVPRGASDFERHDLGLNTDVDIKEGQKVVIGRLGITKDQALFLVMTAKILP